MLFTYVITITFLGLINVVLSCNFSPSVWCSDEEIAKQCQVLSQCRARQQRTPAPVAVGFYYESLCPDCQRTFREQLYPAWKKLSDIMDLELVPYGNAREAHNGTAWDFDCQHGPDECFGNVIETCAIHHLPDLSVVMPFLACIERSHLKPAASAQKCAADQGLNYAVLALCANGVEGNALEHEMAVKTENLNPQHEYVPWFTINGVHNDKIQEEAETDLVKLICETYQGPKPEACSTPASRCHKNR